MEERRECLRIVRALIEIESVYLSDGIEIEGRLRISGGKMKKEFRYRRKERWIIRFQKDFGKREVEYERGDGISDRKEKGRNLSYLNFRRKGYSNENGRTISHFWWKKHGEQRRILKRKRKRERRAR